MKTILRSLKTIAYLGGLIGLLQTGLFVAGGCSTTGVGASAPPISLPAPVTGRMTITSPDETGAALVVGDEGAVPAGSLVHAFNATQDPAGLRVSGNLSASLMSALLSPISSAQAESSFPEVCGHAFHACAVAGADGSFEITLSAENDQEIVVEILNNDGFQISERLRRPVPRNVRHFVRPVADLGLLSNIPLSTRKLYALMPRTLDDPNGLVSVVDLPTGTRTPVPFAGPRPARMAVQTETRQGAIVDPDGNFVAKVDLAINNFDTPVTFPMEGPNDVVFNTTGSEIVVSDTAKPVGISVLLQKIDFTVMTDMDELTDTDLQVLIPGAVNVETTALDLIPFTTTSTFDLVAFIGTYHVDGVDKPAVGLANTSSMQLLAVTLLPAGTVPEDVAFDRTADRVLVTDSGNDKIFIFDFTTTAPVVSPVTTLTPAGEIADPEGFVINPRDLFVHPDNGFAFVNAKNGNADHPDTVLTVDLTADQVVDINPVGFGPTGLVFDPVNKNLFVSTFKSHAVTFWGLPDLLP
ncbi:MAG TPA: hypothetical protein VLJ37_03730 [bacterium]|nr:hypothetical protein [bacterium]